MAIDEREIERLEDIRVIVQARAIGPNGEGLTRKYSNVLLQRAMKALAEGDIEEALWLTQRELDFNCRAFGLADAYTKASVNCLKSLSKLQDETTAKRQASISRFVANVALCHA